jgi:hypothetical protein
MLEALKMAGTSRLMSVMRTLASTEDPLFSQATTSADTDEQLRWGAGGALGGAGGRLQHPRQGDTAFAVR